MIDRLVIGWADSCSVPAYAAEPIDSLMRGWNLRGERVARGFVWERAGALRVRLRCNGAADDYMSCVITFERHADRSGRLGIHGRLDINPTRLLADLDGQSLDQWFGTCRGSGRRCSLDRHDNLLPADAAAPDRPCHFWCDLAADIADRFIAVVMAAFHGDSVRRPSRLWLKQAEVYWEFGTPTPIQSVDEVVPAIRACANATEGYYERGDNRGLPVLSLSLASGNSRRLAVYPRDGRIRMEVRYLRDVSRYARGAGCGDLCDRLRCVAESAALHVNRALHATLPYRRQNPLHGFGGLVEFIQRVNPALGGGSRVRAFAEELLRNRYIRAGDQRGCIVTLNEAQRLLRAGVLSRRPIRARDIGGRVYALDSYFGRLPRRF